jgi:hypothetical protein
MSAVLIAAVTSILALLMAAALVDQWRERRRTYQIVWAAGMLFFGIASACEAIGAAAGWSTGLFRIWWLTGAVWTAGWLGLGTAFLLARTRFGYAFAVCLALAGLFTLLTQAKNNYAGAGSMPVLYLIAGLILALAVAIETYFQNERWPRIAAIGIVGATLLSLVLVVSTTLPDAPIALDAHGVPVLDPLPGSLRLLTPFMNITGGFALILGALFSAYVFMPKRRVLAYSLDPEQSGDQMLFNLLIAPVAIVVNFVASLPGAIEALVRGRLHSRVPATLLIAVGAIFISGTDLGVKGGGTEIFALSKLVGVAFIFLGFLVSIEAFKEFRVPFTEVRLGRPRREQVPEPDVRGSVARSH